MGALLVVLIPAAFVALGPPGGTVVRPQVSVGLRILRAVWPIVVTAGVQALHPGQKVRLLEPRA